MHFFRSVLKYILSYVLGLVFSALVLSTAVSYLVIENIAKGISEAPKKVSPVDEDSAEFSPEEKDPWINANFLELTQFGRDYSAELTAFDGLAAEVATTGTAKKICSLVCNPTQVDSTRAREERTDYLVQYYKSHKKQALADPVFHIKLREIGFLSSLFPHSFRRVLDDLLKESGRPLSLAQKISYTFDLEKAILKELFKAQSHIETLRRDKRTLYALRNIVNACQTGAVPRKQVITKCEKRFPNGLE